MAFIEQFFTSLNGIVWGPAMLVLIMGTGLYLTIGLKFMPIRQTGNALRALWASRYSTTAGDISPFNALMITLAATVGTGNIVGVATAIGIGGPGAVFWMWMTALVGMATKYAEAFLAVKYREVDERGEHLGGPMYYIKNGLGPKWAWLGSVFAVFGALAGFGIGNMVQANSVADAMHLNLGVPLWLSALIMAVLVFLVLIGGIKRIGEVAGQMVPVMALIYVGGGLIIVAYHYDQIPWVLTTILTSAFTPTAATGGFAGAGVMLAIQMGVARGVFSNEAGMGSAAIPHAAAKTNDPIRQGTIATLGTFIDTIIVCSITAMVIMVSGHWNEGLKGAELSSAAFASGLPGFGHFIMTFGLIIFAFTTLLGWSINSERCLEYLFGLKAVMPFRLLWVAAIPVGAMVKLELVWLIADTLNALMAIPNLIGLLLLSPVIFQLSRDYCLGSRF